MMMGRGWHHLSPADKLARTCRQLSGGTLGPTHEGGRSRGRWCRTDPSALTTQNWRPEAHPSPERGDALWARAGGCGDQAGAWMLSWGCRTSAKGSRDGEAAAGHRGDCARSLPAQGSELEPGVEGMEPSVIQSVPGWTEFPGPGGEQATTEGYTLGRVSNKGWN